jgi:colicin import membrane protein
MIAGGEASGDQAARERCLLTYKNCAAVRAAGKAPIPVGEPGYGTHLDSDKDGVGCE